VLDTMIERGKMVKIGGELVREDISGSQVSQCYMTMSMLFRFAKRGRFGKLISESPLADIEQPEKDPAKQLTQEDILTAEDVAALLRKAPKREANIFALADLTGARASELLGLQLRHHDPHAGPSGTLEFESQLRRRKAGDTRSPLIPLKGKKDIAGSEARVLKLSPAANRLLIELRLAAGTGPDTFFFTTSTGKPLSQRNVARSLETVAAEAGIERPCTMHSFRHHYASRMFAAGATIEEVQRDLGHSSREVTIKHYVRLIPTQAADDRAALLHAAAGLA
jgi:integrase